MRKGPGNRFPGEVQGEKPWPPEATLPLAARREKEWVPKPDPRPTHEKSPPVSAAKKQRLVKISEARFLQQRPPSTQPPREAPLSPKPAVRSCRWDKGPPGEAFCWRSAVSVGVCLWGAALVAVRCSGGCLSLGSRSAGGPLFRLCRKALPSGERRLPGGSVFSWVGRGSGLGTHSFSLRAA